MLRLSLSLVLLASCRAGDHLSGWVKSPGYPHGYQPFAKQEWSRCAPKAHRLTLTLTHLDLEDSQDCENDALEIYSGGREIVRLCGKKTFEELQSSVNPLLRSSAAGCLSLVFRSDYANAERHTGFRGFYTAQDLDECEHPSDQVCTHFCHNFIGGYYCSCRPGYILDEDQHTCTVRCSMDLSGSTKGRISGPPRPYPENSRCRYTLSVEPHLQLELEFSADFDVELGPDGQCRDSLTVETRSGMLGPFCGQVAPSPLLTHSSHVVIHFNSDDYGSNRGFTIFYRAKGQTCLGTVTPYSSVAHKRQVYHHGDRVTVTCDIGRRAYAAQDSSQYVTTCQKTGTWEPLHSCDPVQCDQPDIPAEDVLQLVNADDENTYFGDQIQFKCSSPYYLLEGNDTYTCDAGGSWVSVDGRKELPRCAEVCGKTANEVLSTSRILGGSFAKPREIPWQLLISGRLLAGASLIGDRWALTAAHVVDNNEHVELYGGMIDLSQTNGHRLPLDKVIIHPDFQRNVNNRDRTNFDHDIALIRLASRAPLGAGLSSICLPETQVALEEGLLGSITGWGMTENRNGSRILRHASVSVYSSDTCRSTPALGGRPMRFSENMFCAGAEGTDSCSRDSGGPFFVPRLGEGNSAGRGPYRIEGLVSWGANCKERQYKGYYTLVRNYVGWIRDTIKEVEDEERKSRE